MTIVYLTAGAAGMYCGSCLNDNALARAIQRLGTDCILMPVYTPIRTDEEDASRDQVFFGGINVYLQQKLPWLAYLPAWMDAGLNKPWLIRWLTKGAMKTDPKFLGALTVSMLRGMEGSQRKEHQRLCRWLRDEIHPSSLIFTNMLIAGCAPLLKKNLQVPIAVTLQGDDIFFDSLPAPYRQQSIDAMQSLVPYIDYFIAHSNVYGESMSDILKIPREKLRIIPLTIDTKDFETMSWSAPQGPLRIGYFARMAPEKGLHLLVDAFIELHKQHPGIEVRLDLAGWMGPQHEEYWAEQQRKLNQAGLEHLWTYHGSVDRQGKLDFYSQIDWLCVPTVYKEPKGLFVLEGLAAGVPYILPDHGAFPELHERFQNGMLFEALSVPKLTEKLFEVSTVKRRDVGEKRSNALADQKKMSIEENAKRLLDLFNDV